MEFAKAFRGAAFVSLAVAFVLQSNSPTNAQERVSWKMQSAIPSQLSILGEAVLRFERNIETAGLISRRAFMNI